MINKRGKLGHSCTQKCTLRCRENVILKSQQTDRVTELTLHKWLARSRSQPLCQFHACQYCNKLDFKVIRSGKNENLLLTVI